MSSAEEALTLFRGRVKEYRALVADVNLRGRLSGWEIARQVREKEPAFPIIYTTAASAHEWPSHGVPNSILLTKPFAPAQLITALSPGVGFAAPCRAYLFGPTICLARQRLNLPNDCHAIGALVGAEHVGGREFDRFDQDQSTAHVALNASRRGAHAVSSIGAYQNN